VARAPRAIAALAHLVNLGGALAPAIALAVLLPSVLWRVRREDALLRGAFGGRHAAWAGRVGALLP
jgi:protein-S-isoprenylcysteine O-methyltransferase Ste14